VVWSSAALVKFIETFRQPLTYFTGIKNTKFCIDFLLQSTLASGVAIQGLSFSSGNAS